MNALIMILYSLVLISFSQSPADAGKIMTSECVLYSALHKGFLASLLLLHPVF